MAHILSISYDKALLQTRELLLQQIGHTVVSALGFAQAIKACSDLGATLDLVVLGHSIPRDDQKALIAQMRQSCKCPFIALLRPHEAPVEGAARSIDVSEPRDFLAAVRDVLTPKREEKR